MQTVSVLLPIALDKALTYGVPEGMHIAQGDIVEVQLGKKKAQLGVVWSLQGDKNVPANKLKTIQAKRDVRPISQALRALIDRVAAYTLAPRGNVLKLALCCDDAFEPLKPQRVFSIADKGAAKLTEQRQRVLHYLSEQQSPKTQRQIKDALGINYSVLEKMVSAEMLAEEFIEPAEPAPYNLRLPASTLTLSDKQHDAAMILVGNVKATGYSTTVLDGVTGSGKTEVYFHAIREVLQQSEGQVVILLPEIVLTTQLVQRVKKEFGFEPVLWHSNITPKQRVENYRSIQNGSARLVIGARSALFLPYKVLRLIVVDEEHDGSFKQEEGVTYQARDMAVLRASIERIPIVLASATPSLETMVNIEQEKYTRVHLPSRYGAADLPEIELVDMRVQKPDASSWISPPLHKALQDTISAGHQSILFLNRRGYAPLTLCRTCGHRMQCPHCSTWLVEHRSPPRLLCHHCGHRCGVPKECPECESDEPMVACGPGVERLLEEVQRLFPKARVAIMTSESATSASAVEDIIRRVERQEIDILIGTQIIAKGHHFPHLALVGIIDADLGLEGGDLRAAERTYQLLHQVAGRAGRAAVKGKVLVQSYMPENSVIQAMASHNRDEFLARERESRRKLCSPPYSRMAAIVVSGKNESLVQKAGRGLIAQLPRDKDLLILGPAPAPIAMLRQQYRYRILLKSPRSFPLHNVLRQMMTSAPHSSSVRVKLDVDPYSFF